MVSSSHFSGYSDSSSSSNANPLNQYEGGSAESRLRDTPPGPRFPNLPPPPYSFSRTGGLVSSCMSSFPEAERSSKPDGDDFSKPVLTYIDQLLMEESSEERLCLSHDPSALRATEKSLYDVIAVDRMLNASGATISNSNRLVPRGNYRPPFPMSHEPFGSWPSSRSSLISFANCVHNDAVGASLDEFPVIRSNNHELALQYTKRGIDDAQKFLCRSIQLIVDTEERSWAEKLNIAANKYVRENKSPESSKGRKNHLGEDSQRYSKKERTNKQVAVSIEETELAEAFDRLLLCHDDDNKLPLLPGDGNDSVPAGQCRSCRGSSRIPVKKRDKRDGHTVEVDLRHLLNLCAEAVSSDDYRTANDRLAQISQHSTPMGDGVQRLAHYFAKGLEARLSGCMVQKPNVHTLSMKVTVADMLRYYQTMFHGCPFIRIMISFANNMIAKVAEQAKTLHVVDFGILHGFQWPLLIQLLSKRPGGPPKLRITGIEMPQQGLRPWARIEETGIQLAKCCKRLGVPFEYHGIATNKWETIKINELKLNQNEVLAVNCLLRFRNLLDETVTENNPRDAVLQLIREIKPDVFAQSIVNGSHNSPFFLTRFREALFHFSVLFDMMDANLSRDSMERMFVEGEFYGRQAMNVISCEGAERLERPETYKQWQNRVTKAGFEQLQLDQRLLEIYQTKLKESFNGDFSVYEHNKWMLQGYKGRIIYASTGWKPA